MVKPNFFIVGAPKSGTTALYEYLKEHPRVYLPEKKEIYFLCHDLHFTTPPLSESEYESYYKNASDEKAVGDGWVYHLMSAGGAEEIKKYNREAKIIMMLRNPVEMVYSFHGQLVFNGDEPIENFEEALNAEPDRREGKRIPAQRRCPVEAYFYSSVAKYYEQIVRYKAVFSEEKMHIILYDDFKANVLREYVKVLNFLGLEEIMPRRFEAVNYHKAARSKVFQKFLMNPPGFVKAAGRALFPHHTKRRDRLMEGLWKLNAKKELRKPLTPQLKRRLEDMYRADVEKLATLVNRDLSEWLKN